ncbi:DUF1097 domain-containing protein [Vibrio sp. ZSDZ34]|uniref:DUF1097 domain-containing protein n=1 Tax=Vibrio gelatinilyticus TaxID=2893468 RepID=A0A9X2AVP5_9VIBR|nr:DUF1097 domain-containing protein [Vibrio gelatinilyticus]MCJ2377094.1 DUF1097 domain-containing protein [Vibrio gelatinilyticus]
MNPLIAISLTTGVLSGLWGWLSISLGLLSWAGFLGCTSFFASPSDGPKGLAKSMMTNLSGVAWALVIIKSSSMFDAEIVGYIMTAIVSFMMCIQAKRSWLAYIPGTFIGACATFAANGDWQIVAPSLMLGGLFGFSMKSSGLWLSAMLSNANTASTVSEPSNS